MPTFEGSQQVASFKKINNRVKQSNCLLEFMVEDKEASSSQSIFSFDMRLLGHSLGCAQPGWLLPCLSFPNIRYNENQQAHGEQIKSCFPLDCLIRFDYSLSTTRFRLFHINISALDFSQCL
jgi:hypothetical protein